MKFTKSGPLKGEVTIPGDKSISHRSIMFGALAKGTTRVSHFLEGADCLSTISCFRKLGIQIERDRDSVIVHGKGLHGLTAPMETLDCGNSGTTTRMISGILTPQPFVTTLTGDASIQKRPMNRIIEPLSMMGAQITSLNGNGCAPLRIQGAPVHAIHFQSKVASAQVKSAILLAGMYADGVTSVTEPYVSRNHTELMLRNFGAKITTEGTTASIEPEPELTGCDICVPGDISSAAYFIAAALIVPGSEVLLKNVGINPTRDGMIRVVKAMGGNIELLNVNDQSGEPTADLLVSYSSLHGTTIRGEIIPTLIDELPVIAILAAYAEGTTVIADAQELKVKESNRIDVMVDQMVQMGIDVEKTEDGMMIHGGKPVHGTTIYPNLDHRIAMSFAVASLCADGETQIQDAEIVNVSFPTFYDDLKRLQQQ